MKITRLYTGSDQKSYFEEIELKFGGDQKNSHHRLAAGGHGRFSQRCPGNCPRSPSGAAPAVSGDDVRLVGDRGKQRREKGFKAGDVMLADDTTGEGHISRVLGSEPHIFMTVPLAE